jgi:NADP-dependent 3-hydroxy acid dehydrogenase YdfG
MTARSVDGIGSALVEEFHTKGLHVYATARSRTKTSHLGNLPNVTILELDDISNEGTTATIETIRTQ